MNARALPLRRAFAVLLLAGVLLALSGCDLTIQEETYEPIPIQSGAVGRIVASTVDVQARERDGDIIRTSLGTGVVVRADGLVVTADHVLAPEPGGVASRDIEVIDIEGRRADATLVARIPDRDLAFLRVDLAGLRPATIAPDLSRLTRGDRVIAVGAPHHFRRFAVRGRIVDVLRDAIRVEGRDLGVLIQSTVRIREGFSGGPLADARGRLIGITVGATVPVQGDPRTAVAVPAQAVADALALLEAAAPPSPELTPVASRCLPDAASQNGVTPRHHSAPAARSSRSARSS